MKLKNTKPIPHAYVPTRYCLDCDNMKCSGKKLYKLGIERCQCPDILKKMKKNPYQKMVKGGPDNPYKAMEIPKISK